MDYYSVTAKFGHVGRNSFILKTVPVRAESGKEAAAYVRKMPRAKHHYKDAIIQVLKIDEGEFRKQREEYKKDPYFYVGSRQEQQKLCPEIEKVKVKINNPPSKIEHRKKRKEKIKYLLEKNKILDEDSLKQARLYTIQTI